MDSFDWNNNRNSSEIVTSVFLRLSKEEAIGDALSWRDACWEILKGVGRMFYIVDPTETSYSRPENVPNIFKNVSSVLFVLDKGIKPSNVLLIWFREKFYKYLLTNYYFYFDTFYFHILSLFLFTE